MSRANGIIYSYHCNVKSHLLADNKTAAINCPRTEARQATDTGSELEEEYVAILVCILRWNTFPEAVCLRKISILRWNSMSSGS